MTLKLAFVAPGSIGHTLKWVNGLAERGVDVTLITQHAVSAELNSKVNVYNLPFKGGKGYFLNAPFLHQIIKKISPDVINVHYASGYGTLALLACIKPYILSVWGSDVYEFPFQSKFKFWLIKKSLLNAEHIASTSYAMADQVRLLLQNKSLPIFITPFGVDFSKFIKTTTPFKNDVITIGIVKKLEYKYGIDLLIEGFAIASQKLSSEQLCCYKPLKLMIIGDGTQDIELEQLTHKLDVFSQTDFLGLIPNNHITEFINKIDIFVVPSRIESFGVSAIEALGCERPCIVANTGGLPEVIINDQTGKVVEADSAQAIADAILYYIQNKSEAITLGKNGRQDVINKYSEEVAFNTMLNVYNQNRFKNVS